MAEPKETIQDTSQEKRQPVISASRELWQVFEAWMKRLGCTTLPEGLRAAMRQVTGFNGKSQE